MGKQVKGVKQVREVRFDNPRLSKVGVDVVSLEQLRRRMGGALDLAERPDFYLLLFVERGGGRHMVDFVEHPLKRGHVLFVRPGQVQQWRMEGTLGGELVLVSPEALAPFIARAEADMQLLALDEWPATFVPRQPVFSRALADVRRLRADIARFQGGALQAAIIWHELLASLLRLMEDHSAAGKRLPRQESKVHRIFMRELEKHIHMRISVRELARRIGYSESTLSRACLETTGSTAKEAVDQRVALEAKRLLVHSQATVVRISHQLGFSEPTNFVKFFRRMAGVSPLAFRATHAGAA